MSKSIDEKWKCPDYIWEELKKILHKYVASPLGGRPPVNQRAVADGIFYVLKTGIQWKAMPSEFPSGSTCHRYFQTWVRDGVFLKLWQTGVARYEERKGIDWKKLNIDSSQTKAPLGGEKNRAKPNGSWKKRNKKINFK